MSATSRTIRAATRGSPLALWQTAELTRMIAEVDPSITVEPVIVQTEGDADKTTPLWLIGGKGVFVKEVQAAVLDGRADVAVHSAKDLPSVTLPGLSLVAAPRRGDPRDALVGSTLSDLGPGAPIATGSVRRRSQLAHHRPDLTFSDLRGNIATRLERVPEGGAIIMAVAALQRLGMDEHIADLLEPDVMLPQVGQGTLAIECRTDDVATQDVLRGVDHQGTHRCLDAERAYLATLGGDCDIPAGAFAELDDPTDEDGSITMTGVLASLDGHVCLRSTLSGGEPEALGTAVASDLLDHAGGDLLIESSRS